jgi:hypothetical protein
MGKCEFAQLLPETDADSEHHGAATPRQPDAAR